MSCNLFTKEPEFTDLVVKKTKGLRQGAGLSGEVDVGEMTLSLQVEKVESHVQDAIKKGATILTGGERNKELGGHFYKPTVLVGVDSNCLIVKEETFGPVLPIMTYQTEEEVIKLANDSVYALNAYIWAGDVEKGKRVASKIIAGTVNVNESVLSYALPQTPWGGPKESGIGHTHGTLGLKELVRMRHVHVNTRASKKNNFWWYGYSPEKLEMMKNLCIVLFGKGLKRLKAFLRINQLSKKITPL